MTVEAATYISDLNASYPGASDPFPEGDDHLRLIKSAIKATLPSVAGAVTATHTELNLLAGVTGAIRTATSTPISGEIVLMRDTGIITGTPSTVSFVNGSGGVTISSAYDEYWIVIEDVQCGTVTQSMRLQLSTNAGSSYPSNATGTDAQFSTVASGVAGAGQVSSDSYFPVSGQQTITNTGATYSLHAVVRLTRNPSGNLVAGAFAEYQCNVGNKVGAVRGRIATTGSAWDAVQIYWSSGNFANQGRVKFFGRKA